MADGYWNIQQQLHPSSGLLKRPRPDFGSFYKCIHFLYLGFYMCICITVFPIQDYYNLTKIKREIDEFSVPILRF